MAAAARTLMLMRCSGSYIATRDGKAFPTVTKTVGDDLIVDTSWEKRQLRRVFR